MVTNDVRCADYEQRIEQLTHSLAEKQIQIDSFHAEQR
jgi:hypothetical protein